MTNKNTPAIIKEISPITKQAEQLTITTQAELVEATTLLSNLNKYSDKVEAEKAKVLDPLNTARKAEIARWKPILETLDQAITSIRSKMTLFATQAVQTQLEEETAIANRIKAGRGNLSLDTGLARLSEVEKAPKQVETDAGRLTFVPTPKLHVIDASLIPDEYWTLDESAVFKALKAGTQINGAEIIIEQVPRNFRG